MATTTDTPSANAAWTPTLGALVGPDGVTFRVWAPLPQRVELVLHLPDGDRIVPTERQGEYAVARVADAGPGTRYRYRLDGAGPFPDPCSRSQPEGVHGPSEVVDPRAFAWTDADWVAPDFTDVVIYESHIGTLTPGGTFDAAIEQFARLRSLGITAIEVCPVASFPGRWNWGYDGVMLYAPAAPYGGPEGLRRFVDAAHAAGLAVIMDVVYNHFGPDGNYTGLYSDRYLTSKHKNPWGDSINYDDVDSAEVRRFVIENLLHFVHEHHIDGFRLDATFAIIDTSPRHLLAEIADTLDQQRRGAHRPYLIAETPENDAKYFLPTAEGGYGFDAVWADDFHHGVRTILQPENQGYLADYAGTAEELAQSIARGFLVEKGIRATDQSWSHYVFCIQNHDQIGNRAFGQRLNVTAAHADFLAASLLLLFLPQTPMLFQGQEFLASTPFLYFTDHNEELGKLVTEGRRREFADFAQFSDPAVRDRIPDPQDPRTFERSKLDLDEASYGVGLLVQDLYRAALELRAADPVLAAARRSRPSLQAEARDEALLITIEAAGGRRILVVNLGDQVTFDEPGTGGLRPLLHTGATHYGGNGVAPQLADGRIIVPGHSAALLG
ncbi:MAG TPA: malto-oligosyltrehalose trehalohydrolase [Thermomicrobiales bacterium]|jgi:maltooligosyltrehalose trehalohydrolase